jgi:hypothetical protein
MSRNRRHISESVQVKRQSDTIRRLSEGMDRQSAEIRRLQLREQWQEGRLRSRRRRLSRKPTGLDG